MLDAGEGIRVLVSCLLSSLKLLVVHCEIQVALGLNQQGWSFVLTLG